MRNPKKQAVLIILALFFSISSIAFARLGEPYRCTGTGQYQYMESNRDERGIPLKYLKRSVQTTYCAPVNSDRQTLTLAEWGHSIQYAHFFIDVAFWYGLLVILSIIFRKIDRSKK